MYSGFTQRDRIILAVTDRVGFDWFANGLKGRGENFTGLYRPESDTSVVALHNTLPIDLLYQGCARISNCSDY